jgi:two-component system cell cycle response regulator DivK
MEVLLMARILLVEDNEISRQILVRRLRRLGYEVLEAASGDEAIAGARTLAPDIVLLDMTLPGRDGWEIARELRGTPETSSLPVIALTAHTLPSDRERALAAGCDEYEPKPVELPRLVQKIETLLRRQLS